MTWERLGVEGLSVEHPPSSARIRSIEIERAFAKVFIDREGKLNLMKLTASGGEAASPHFRRPCSHEAAVPRGRSWSILTPHVRSVGGAGRPRQPFFLSFSAMLCHLATIFFSALSIVLYAFSGFSGTMSLALPRQISCF